MIAVRPKMLTHSGSATVGTNRRPASPTKPAADGHEEERTRRLEPDDEDRHQQRARQTDQREQ